MRTLPVKLVKPVLLLALTGSLLFASAAPALAWSNGGLLGNGFGTHDWVINEAAHLAGNPRWLNKSVAFRASDDPDTLLLDWPNHAYDEWGDCEGQAPQRVAVLFGKAAKAYKARSYADASKQVGLLAHYYADVCNPLHTDAKSADEKYMHSSYELRAQTLTNGVGENRTWIVYDGFQRVVRADSKTILAARYVHPRYSQLVRDYRRYGYNRWVAAATRIALNRAANDLADIIRSVPSAQVASTPPDVLPDGVISWSNAWMHLGATATVQGQVVTTKYAAGSSGSPTFLNVGADCPSLKRLTVLIWGDRRGAFVGLPKAPEQYYFGRTVRVTGRMVLYQGAAEIVVEGPGAIEVVR